MSFIQICSLALSHIDSDRRLTSRPRCSSSYTKYCIKTGGTSSKHLCWRASKEGSKRTIWKMRPSSPPPCRSGLLLSQAPFFQRHDHSPNSAYSFSLQAFGQSFLQPDIHIFKQNLSYLESLNSKHKLYHRVSRVATLQFFVQPLEGDCCSGSSLIYNFCFFNSII